MVTGIRRRFLVALSLLGLVISTLVVVGVAPAAGATTFVVDTTVDDGALNGCTLAPGDCSLRGAIAKANTTVGADTIDFLIPGVQCPGGVCPITLTEGPLTITEAVTIDATTQVQNGGPQANVCATETEPSYMRIELVVDPTGADGNGFVVNYTGGPTTIRGFAIGTNFNGSGFWSGIDTYDGSGHHIACNHLGLDAAGTSQLGSEDFDAMVAVDGYADGVIIGTDGDGNNDIAERNVFGSDGYGIYINGNTNNRISGNYFGFTPDGTSTISSGSVYMRQDSSNNLVGVDGDGVSDDIEVNYFGNAYASIIITTGTYVTTGNEIVGNVIGMGPTGTTATSTRGISVASDVAFSGYEIRDNTILGAVQHAIVADAPGSGLLIDGNLIGVTADGTAGANGTGIGINGTTSPQLSGNFITNSSSSGVQLADTATLTAGSTGNCVVGNTAGVTNSTGTSVNFENNWWGAIDGPSGSGPGSGDTVSADVDYDPWSTSPGRCATPPRWPTTRHSASPRTPPWEPPSEQLRPPMTEPPSSMRLQQATVPGSSPSTPPPVRSPPQRPWISRPHPRTRSPSKSATASTPTPPPSPSTSPMPPRAPPLQTCRRRTPSTATSSGWRLRESPKAATRRTTTCSVPPIR